MPAPRRILTYFSADTAAEGDGELLRIWKLSWQRRGWEPRILTPRTARQCPGYKSEGCDLDLWYALKQSGGSVWFADLHVVNFSLESKIPLTPSLRGVDIQANAAPFCFVYKHGGCRPATIPEFGAPGWEDAPLVNFSPASILRHFKQPLPPAAVILSCNRRF